MSCHRLAFIGLGLLLAGPGCRSDEPRGEGETAGQPAQQAAAAGGDIDACALLTREEAEKALGQDMDDAVHKSGGATCIFQATTAEAAGGVGIHSRVVLSVFPHDPETLEERIKDAEESWRGRREAIEGLGDRALWVKRQLFVVRGSHLLSVVIVSGTEKDVARTKTAELARKALDRLP